MKLKLPKTIQGDISATGEGSDRGIVFCAAAFFKVTQVPVGARQCYLVLHKTEPNVHADSIYSITRPRRTKRYFIERGPSSCIREVGHALYWCTRYALARLYNDGYRYITIEYVEN